MIQTFHLAPSLGQLNVKIPAILLPSLLASAVLGTRHVLAYVFIRNYSSPTELAIQHHEYSIFIAQVAVSLLELFTAFLLGMTANCSHADSHYDTVLLLTGYRQP